MAISSRSTSGLSLAALFVLLLSILDFAFAAPLPHDSVDVTVSDNRISKRGEVFPGEDAITVDEYKRYLQSWYPNDLDKFIFYTADSETQAQAFEADNEKLGYYSYDDLFNFENTRSHWKAAFPKTSKGFHRPDNAETSSQAMSEVAKGKVLVFGGADYLIHPKAQTSLYKLIESDGLKDGLRDGRVTEIAHMQKDATELSQVMATEDADGKFTWMEGFQEGDANSSPKGVRVEGVSYGNPPAKEGGSSVPYGNPAAQDPGRAGGTGAGTPKPAPKPVVKPVPKPIKPPTHI